MKFFVNYFFMNLIKATASCEFVYIYWESLWWKTSFISECSAFSSEILFSLICKLLFLLHSLSFGLIIILKIQLFILKFQNIVPFQKFFAADQNYLDLLHFTTTVFFMGSWGILDWRYNGKKLILTYVNLKVLTVFRHFLVLLLKNAFIKYSIADECDVFLNLM